MPAQVPPGSGGDGDRGRGAPKKPAGPGKQFFVPSPGGAPPPKPAQRRPAQTRPTQNRPAQKPAARRPPAQGQPTQRPPARQRSPQAGSPQARSDRPRPTTKPAPRTSPAARAPVVEPQGRRRRFRPRWLLAIPLLLVVGLLGTLFWAYSAYNRIERIDLSAVLDPVTGDSTNYLLVGSDSRDEFDPEVDSGVTGSRSDTLIVLQTTPDGSAMMSIPRDLWVTIADTGEEGRINGAYNRGPANLVQTVKDALGIPINHYMEVGFGSFAGLVDALGGITVDFPHPAFDSESGLVQPEAGPVVLDGQQALAYARSRHYTEIVDGREVTDPTADLGRQQRQQMFLRTALNEVGSTRNPFTLVRVADAMSSELIIDSGLGFGEALSLVRKLGNTDPETVILPIEGVRRGQAAVVVLVEPDAQAVLQRFR